MSGNRRCQLVKQMAIQTNDLANWFKSNEEGIDGTQVNFIFEGIYKLNEETGIYYQVSN